MNVSGPSITASVWTENISISFNNTGAANNSNSSPPSTNHPNKPSGFIQDALEALQSVGVNIPPPPANGAEPSNNSQNNGNNDGQQALHQFMHDLFHALRGPGQNNPGSDSNNQGNSNSVDKYNNFASNIQNLLNSLNSGDESSTNQQLENDFSNLMSLFGTNPSSSSTANSSSPNLEDFLNQLATNAAQHNQTSSGSLISVKT